MLPEIWVEEGGGEGGGKIEKYKGEGKVIRGISGGGGGGGIHRWDLCIGMYAN